MRLSDPLLIPFSLMYRAATDLRNHLFDLGIKKSSSFEIPLIVIGNLSVGGTGKTPMVEWLITKLKDTYSLAMLSRGYRRKTNGFQLANAHTRVEEIGDEPFQVFQKFHPNVRVAVGEERALAIPMILAEHPETQVILLDDAYQHRYVSGDLNILLTTFDRPFFSDHLLPLGRLRESRKGSNRANIIIVTKCPDQISAGEKQYFIREIHKYASAGTPVFFAGVRYHAPIPLFEKGNFPSNAKKVLVLSGIANNENLIRTVSKTHEVLENISFADHHQYKKEDMELIQRKFREHRMENPVLLTTEKDAVKLKQQEFLPYLKEIPIFALPIGMDFKKEDATEILSLVQQSIRRKKYSSEV
ncbi:tetraacyldisaccharide 4'-kinase [Pleomorphovibrio marinus]|uniref:tetraacyldisaccharide 4'-kinase n=1 Tax=Pleomorphovibrio marinus TaxID=2164132 RepID=UPI000E0A58FF|nr:tetraacyldisaccharide 4'-kinase [Pleomorphovibrio marinus]